MLQLSAKLHLAVPASPTPFKRAFSIAVFIVNARRCSLKPDLVEAMHFLNDSLWLLEEKDLLCTEFRM